MAKTRFSVKLAIVIAAAILAQGGAFLVLYLLGANEQPFALLVLNTAFLLASILCIRLFRMSAEDVGLKFLPGQFLRHTVLCLVVLLLYFLYYILGVRISGLRPFTPATLWTLLGYLVVAFAEEIYFRGLLYHLFANRYSDRAAVLGTALLFALFHIRQGPAALFRFPTGLLWGSVRYSTGMIFLLALPVHFAYNAVWLLFQGNWDNPPAWAFLLPLVELALGLLILATRSTVPQLEKIDISKPA